MRVGGPGEKIWESSTNPYFLLETQSPSNVMVVSFTRPSEGGIRAFSLGPRAVAEAWMVAICWGRRWQRN